MNEMTPEKLRDVVQQPRGTGLHLMLAIEEAASAWEATLACIEELESALRFIHDVLNDGSHFSVLDVIDAAIAAKEEK